LLIELRSGTASRQLRTLQDNVAHLLHLRLEIAQLEHHDGFCSLIHLVDCVVHRGNQALDVGAIERRDKRSADGDKNFACYIVGLGFKFKNLLAVTFNAFATLQQSA
jgi:hypothetical protein